MTKKILIVEDEIILQEAYKIVLTASGFDVYTANNGAEGIQQLKAIHPDLVLLDLFMPVMGGKEFMRNVDTNDFPHTKFIVSTNLSDTDDEKEMLELGAHIFVLKSSMAPRDLINLIEKVIA